MHRRAFARLLAALSVVLALSRGLPAQQPSLADSAQEVLFEFRFSSLPRSPLLALAVGDSTYLPVGAIFQALEIEYVFDAAANRAQGYYLADSAGYTIDLSAGTATVGRRTLRLSHAEAIARPPELYLTPGALRSIFGLDFLVDSHDLAVALNTDKPMPVLVNAHRRAMEQRGRRQEVVEQQAPLRFPWRRSAIGPGLLQYELAANGSGSARTLGLSFGFGAEVAGGDLQLSSESAFTGGSSVTRGSGHWSYALPAAGDRPTRIDLGQAISNGLRSFDIQGIRLTNEPWQPRRVAGSYVVQGHTVPGWDTELFVDGEFYEVARADSLGRVSFTLPLRYGTTFIRLRYVGPAGQQTEEEMRLQVPFTVLPQGTLEYSFAAGRRTTYHTRVLQATAAYGLTSILTGRLGLDRIDDTQHHTHAAPYASATARLPGNFLLTGTAAPGTTMGLDVGKVTRVGGTIDVAYNANASDEVFNPDGFRNQLRVHAFTPAQLRGFNILARLDGESLWEGGSGRANYEGEVAVNFAGLRPSLLYRELRTRSAGTTSANGTFAVSTLFYPGGFAAHWHMPQGTLLQTELDFNSRPVDLQGWSTAVSARATRYGQVRATLSRALGFPVRLDLSFQFQGARFRSSTAAFGGVGGGYAQTLAGSLSYDPTARDVVFSGRDGLGQGMARIRPFVDINGNGRRDPGEESLKAGYIRLNQALPTFLEDSGHVTRIEALAPYTRYTARVDVGEVENPLWAPAFDSFSFIALPERVRTLDVPFYPTGIVDGVVNREIPSGTQPVPGLTIRIHKPDGSLQASVPTFGDGAFYAGGLPPGQYRIAPDSLQLAALRVQAVPASIDFTVSTTGEGNPAGSLAFLLKPLGLDQMATNPDEDTAASRIPAQLPPGQAQPEQKPAPVGVVSGSDSLKAQPATVPAVPAPPRQAPPPIRSETRPDSLKPQAPTAAPRRPRTSRLPVLSPPPQVTVARRFAPREPLGCQLRLPLANALFGGTCTGKDAPADNFLRAFAPDTFGR